MPEERSSPVLPVLIGCLAVAALSLVFPSTPTYDPWAWIMCGREILQLDLVTTGGPSWKPLPVLFTTPFAIFGDDVAGCFGKKVLLDPTPMRVAGRELTVIRLKAAPGPNGAGPKSAPAEQPGDEPA